MIQSLLISAFIVFASASSFADEFDQYVGDFKVVSCVKVNKTGTSNSCSKSDKMFSLKGEEYQREFCVSNLDGSKADCNTLIAWEKDDAKFWRGQKVALDHLNRPVVTQYESRKPNHSPTESTSKTWYVSNGEIYLMYVYIYHVNMGGSADYSRWTETYQLQKQ